MKDFCSNCDQLGNVTEFEYRSGDLALLCNPCLAVMTNPPSLKLKVTAGESQWSPTPPSNGNGTEGKP